jgi:beta-lactam-binding protein with PASTA domain
VTANEYDDSVSVIMNATVFCIVPNVRGKTLARAKQALDRADCSVGKVRRVHSKRVKRHRVISQSPRPGTVLADGAGVRLVVSRGKKH